MRAAVLEEFSRPLVIREFDRPPLGPRQILVRMRAAGVCGSDIHMWHGHDPRTPLPIILGHEGVGQVVEVGKSIHPFLSVTGREINPGDRIIWERGVTCGHCYSCAIRQTPNLCPNRWVYGIHRPSSAPPHLVGCYGDHIVLEPNTIVMHLDDYKGPSDALLASTSCSGATAANAIEAAGIQPGDTVLVQGSGPLGLYLMAFARAGGASTVIVVGGSPDSLALAKRLGANLTISYRDTTPDDRADAVRNAAPHGVDTVLESSGKPESISEGISVLRTGGAYVSTGFAVPVGTLPLDPYYDIVRKNLRLQGVWTSHARHLRHALSLVCRNPEPFEGIVTHKFSLDQATDALQAMESRKAIKSAIIMGDS